MIAGARLGYLFDAPTQAIRESLSGALGELFVAVEMGGVLDPTRMGEYLGAALVVEDASLTAALAAPRRNPSPLVGRPRR